MMRLREASVVGAMVVVAGVEAAWEVEEAMAMEAVEWVEWVVAAVASG